MRVVVMNAPGDVRVEDYAEPTILKPTDAVIRLSATCICGSDLWPYRGIEPLDGPRPMGHEYCGIVEEVGSAVTTMQAGPVRGRVVLRLRQHLRDLPGRLPAVLPAPGGVRPVRCRPGASGCGCRWPTAPWSPPRRCPPTIWSRTSWPPPTCSAPAGSPPSPPKPGPGKTVAVVGDGAVGLLGVLAAKQLGRGADHRDEPSRTASAAGPGVRRHRHRHRTRRRGRRGDQGPDRRARRALGDRGRRHPGVDDAGHPLHPARWARRATSASPTTSP